MNLRDAHAYHLAAVALAGGRPDTVQLYRTYELRFIAFLEGKGIEPTMDALSIGLVEDAMRWAKANPLATGRRNGEQAVRMLCIVCKLWAKFLYRRRLLPSDPLAELRSPRVDAPVRAPFSKDEAKRLVRAASQGDNGARDVALLLLLFDTGCRIGELMATELDDLDLEAGSILFRHTKNRQPRLVRFRVDDASDGGPCNQALRRWLEVRWARGSTHALFVTRTGEPLEVRRAQELFRHLGKVAQVPECTPHRARHTAATEFLSELPGAENQLRDRLGHMSNNALRAYVHTSDPTAYRAAGAASLSAKWDLEGRAVPKPKPQTVDALAALIQADPGLRAALLQALGVA